MRSSFALNGVDQMRNPQLAEMQQLSHKMKKGEFLLIDESSTIREAALQLEQLSTELDAMKAALREESKRLDMDQRTSRGDMHDKDKIQRASREVARAHGDYFDNVLSIRAKDYRKNVSTE